MTFRGVFAFVAALALVSSASRAQGVLQSGLVTPGHAVMWSTSGVIMDAGGTAPPATLNTRLNGLGIVGSAFTDCRWTSYSQPYAQLCLGFDAVGNGLLTYSNVGAPPTGTINFNVNGTTTTLGPAPIATPTCTADGSPTHDCSGAINAVLASTVNGQNQSVYLPPGTYYIAHQLNVTNGQCLYGSGRGNTIILVDQGFDPTALGAIYMTGPSSTQYMQCVHDLQIKCAQPTDQGSRANFLTLAQGGTSGLGGTGVKYPPAIFSPSNDGTREKVYNVQIQACWDGIDIEKGSGAIIQNIEESDLDVGLTLNNGVESGSIDHYEHFSFGISTSSNLYNVFNDGNGYCMKIGRMDGAAFLDIKCIHGRVQLTAAYTFGSLTDVEMDSANSTMAIYGSTLPGLRLAHVYTTGTTNGTTDTDCNIHIYGGEEVNIVNPELRTSGVPNGAICQTGGAVDIETTITGGFISTQSASVTGVLHSAGFMKISGVSFHTLAGGNYTVPLITVTGGAIISVTGNDFPVGTGTNVGAISIATDQASNYVCGNNYNNWTFTPPGYLGTYCPPSVLPIQSGVPLILAGGAAPSMANNGALSGLTALPETFANAYVYLPAGAIQAASAAGWYFFQGSSATAGTVFNNVYMPCGALPPQIPASPTPFVTTGPGAFSQVTAEVQARCFNVSANTLGPHGYMEVKALLATPNNANAKTDRIKFGGNTFYSNAITTSASTSALATIQNRGEPKHSVSAGADSNGIGLGNSTNSPSTFAIDTTVSKTIQETLQLTNAADFLISEYFDVRFRPGWF